MNTPRKKFKIKNIIKPQNNTVTKPQNNTVTKSQNKTITKPTK